MDDGGRRCALDGCGRAVPATAGRPDRRYCTPGHRAAARRARRAAAQAARVTAGAGRPVVHASRPGGVVYVIPHWPIRHGAGSARSHGGDRPGRAVDAG